jgi:hypothetical protein
MAALGFTPTVVHKVTAEWDTAEWATVEWATTRKLPQNGCSPGWRGSARNTEGYLTPAR